MNELTPYVLKSPVPHQQEYPLAAPGAVTIDPQQAANLRDYWQVIRKRKGIIATCFLAR